MRFGNAAGPDQIGHDDARGAIFDKGAQLPAAQQALGNAHRRPRRLLQTPQRIRV